MAEPYCVVKRRRSQLLRHQTTWIAVVRNSTDCAADNEDDDEMHSTTVAAHEPHLLRRVVTGAGDVLGGLAMLLFIPLAILAVGIPLAIGVRLVLWATGLL